VVVDSDEVRPGSNKEELRRKRKTDRVNPESPAVKPLAVCDILKRKWSRRLIREILGEPIGEMTNPHFSTWPKMKYYHFDTVVQSESDPRWLAYQPKRALRVEAGKKAARTRAERREAAKV
jgi:hypothetical protein